MNRLSCLITLVVSISISSYHVADTQDYLSNTILTADISRDFAVLFASIQCFNTTDPDTQRIRDINQNFNPYDHLDEYFSRQAIDLLLDRIANKKMSIERVSDPFTFVPTTISDLELQLEVLYRNTDNYSLFFNTAAWLIGRINGAGLHFCLSVIATEKFIHTVITPTMIEVWPQSFINKVEIAGIAGVPITIYAEETHPLSYYMNDPRFSEFHWNWHVDNPIFWNETRYPLRDRKGELFLYMHHQLICRYNAELISNGLPFVTSLVVQPDYAIVEPYYPDILNINYQPYPVRKPNTTLKSFDDGFTLNTMITWQQLLISGIDQGYLVRADKSKESLREEPRGSSLLGGTVGDYNSTVNIAYYGNFHSMLHILLAGMVNNMGPTPGVTSHSETTMRDKVFFRLHKDVDDLYYRLKSYIAPYTANDLYYNGIQIASLNVFTQANMANQCLYTYFDYDTFDISMAARPCRGLGGPRTYSKVVTLRHFPFTYNITVQSYLPYKSYGMVRIFLLPQVGSGGTTLTVEESYHNAIQLDLFPISFEANEWKTILRTSEDSSITRKPIPGIKTLSKVTPSNANGILDQNMKRACGFPNNLLIPKGTKQGLKFKVFVMISFEEEITEDEILPHYPYCGMLNGLKYPDKRSMGFPFDRPGTKFIVDGQWMYANAWQIPILIQHLEN